MNTTNIIAIESIPIFQDNYVWIIKNDAHQAIVVDPGDAIPVIAYLEAKKLSLTAILITHHHWDHTNGIKTLLAHHAVPVFGPAKENIAEITHPIGEPESIQLPDFPISFQILDIPGHTMGHIAYHTANHLFCGDTLFGAGCGRLFEGTPREMYLSLQKIAALPDNTKIYCTHEYTANNLRFAETVEPHNQAIQHRIVQVSTLRNHHQPSLPSTLAEEKATNPFLRCHMPHIIAQAEAHAGKPLQNAIDVFGVLRKWKDEFK